MRRQTNVVSALVQNGHTLFFYEKSGFASHCYAIVAIFDV